VTRAARERGFTLIELMIVVAIVGLLSTVGIPVYKRATIRTRVAERATLMQAMRTGIEDAYSRGVVPAGGLFGAANPAGALGPSKRVFQNGALGWRDINILVQGNTYYRYQFGALEAAGNVPAIYWVMAEGDIDGDGVPTQKQFVGQRITGHWTVNEWPAAGEEDEFTFGSF